MPATDPPTTSTRIPEARPWMPAVRRPWLSLLYLPLYLLTGAIVWFGLADADVGGRAGAAALSALLLFPLALIPARHLPWPVPVVLAVGVAIGSWRAFTLTWPVLATLLLAVPVVRTPAPWIPANLRRPASSTRTVLAWLSLLPLYGFPLPLYVVAAREFSGVGIAGAGFVVSLLLLTVPYALAPARRLGRRARIIVGIALLPVGLFLPSFLASSASLLVVGAVLDRRRRQRGSAPPPLPPAHTEPVTPETREPGRP